MKGKCRAKRTYVFLVGKEREHSRKLLFVGSLVVSASTPLAYLWMKLFNQDPFAMLIVLAASMALAPLSIVLLGSLLLIKRSATERALLTLLLVLNLAFFCIVAMGLYLGYEETRGLSGNKPSLHITPKLRGLQRGPFTCGALNNVS